MYNNVMNKKLNAKLTDNEFIKKSIESLLQKTGREHNMLLKFMKISEEIYI